MKTANSIVIVHFNTTAPSTSRLNRAASATAIRDASAGRNAARVYNTVLQAKGTAVGKAVTLQNQTGTEIRRLGLACPTGGYYVPVKMISKVQNIFDDACSTLDDLKEDIVSTYSTITAEIRHQLGKFADQIEIPSATEVASKFTMRLTVIAQPAAIDGPVLSGIAEEVANRVRAESQAQVADMLRSAHAGPLNDLRDMLAEFSDRLRHADRLHMSQFDRLAEEAKRVRNLNVLDLPEIEEVAKLAERAAGMRDTLVSSEHRVAVAVHAERAAAAADKTLADLGL